MTNILSTQDKVVSFVRKLELYQCRVQVGDMSMFTQLCEQLKHDKADKLINSLQQYFPGKDNHPSISGIIRPFSTNDNIFEFEDV
ncbi:hypothetical protein RN001_010000 [Aquatica leii]|uniref:Uncharacterized protein n=1 Tax=Aquatica leii TaxID=1421715 RepID=A0AAN7P5S4_9COLE|nr:hypothetical protein RN001_010000 [Aquatica leii]